MALAGERTGDAQIAQQTAALDVIVHVRIAREDAKRLRARARQLGCSLSELLRAAALGAGRVMPGDVRQNATAVAAAAPEEPEPVHQKVPLPKSAEAAEVARAGRMLKSMYPGRDKRWTPAERVRWWRTVDELMDTARACLRAVQSR
jgi:hypothetical protein